MGRLGLSIAYIQVVFVSLVSTQVVVGGELGNNYSITRSVRQGCTLAPYLFLFVGEAFSGFLNKNRLSVKGIQWLGVDKAVLECGFADDTTLYVIGETKISIMCK